MKLIPDWRKAWKLRSVQVAALLAGLNAMAGAWVAFNGHIDPILWAGVNMGLGIAVAVARVMLQVGKPT